LLNFIEQIRGYKRGSVWRGEAAAEAARGSDCGTVK